MKRRLYIATFDDDAIEVIKENKIGIELNEMCISELLDEDKFEGTVNFMKEQIKNSGAKDIIAHGPFTEIVPSAIDHRIREAGIVRLNEAYEGCKRVGVNKMVVHTGYMPPLYQKPWHLDYSLKFWKEFMKDKPDDFNICIENVLEDEPYMMKDLVKGLNDPRISLCLDIGHANWSGKGVIPVAEWIKILGKDLGHLHLHNNYGDSDAHNAIDKGNMDMEEIMEAVFKYCREDITMTIESHDCRDSAKWVKTYLDEHQGRNEY